MTDENSIFSGLDSEKDHDTETVGEINGESVDGNCDNSGESTLALDAVDEKAPLAVDKNGVALPSESIGISEEILALAKALQKSVDKRQKKLEKEEETRGLAKKLQEEANIAHNEQMTRQYSGDVRDFNTVTKEVLKASKQVDRAIDSAHKDAMAAERAYLRLVNRLLPNMGYDALADEHEADS